VGDLEIFQVEILFDQWDVRDDDKEGESGDTDERFSALAGISGSFVEIDGPNLKGGRTFSFAVGAVSDEEKL
jgi:hypothetical protein